MKKTDNRMFWKVLVLILKIVLAIPTVLLFTLIRCLQIFSEGLRYSCFFCLHFVRGGNLHGGSG